MSHNTTHRPSEPQRRSGCVVAFYATPQSGRDTQVCFGCGVVVHPAQGGTEHQNHFGGVEVSP